MISNMFGVLINSSLSTSVVDYMPITDSSTLVQTSELVVQSPFSSSFNLTNLYVSISSAPGTGKNYTFTVRKNGADTSLSVTISDSNTSGLDNAHTLSVAAGDIVTLSATPSGTPTSSNFVHWTMLATSVSTHYAQITGGNRTTTNLSTSATSYANLCGFGNNSISWSATETDQEMICPTSGMLSNLYVVTDTSPGTGKSYAIALVQNGSITSLSATISGSSAKTANDTTHSISVSAGDKLSVAATPSGTPTAARYGWGFQFTPTNPGESFFGYGTSAAPSTTATQYDIPFGNGVNFSTESNREVLVGNGMLEALYVALGTAPGGATTRTATIRRNAVSQPLAVTISGTNTSGNVTGANVGLIQTDLVSLQLSESGTPAADTGGVHLGILMYIPVSAPPTTANFLSFF